MQTALSDIAGKDVYFISVTTDPETDTPERLKSWGEKFNARPGWTLVTGEKVIIDQLLEGFNGDPSGRRDHSPTMWIGNDKTGNWAQTYSFADANRIRQLLAELNRKSESSNH